MNDKKVLAVAVCVCRQFENSGLTANQLIELENAINAAVLEHEEALRAENQRLREALKRHVAKCRSEWRWNHHWTWDEESRCSMPQTHDVACERCADDVALIASEHQR